MRFVTALCLVLIAPFALSANINKSRGAPSPIALGPSTTISATNATGFSAPPSASNVWTPNSYIGPYQSSGSSSQTIYIPLTSTSGSGTVHLYVVVGNVIIQWPDAAITKSDWSGAGPISASSTALYQVSGLPPGTFYIGSPSWSSGSLTGSIFAGPVAGGPLPAVPGSGIPQGATFESSTTGSSDITDTGLYAVFAARGANTHHYITSIVVTNSSTTDTVVYIEDGSTIIWAANAKGGGGFVWSPPPYFYQSTANAAINVVCRTGSAAVQVNGLGYWK